MLRMNVEKRIRKSVMTELRITEMRMNVEKRRVKNNQEECDDRTKNNWM